MNRCQSCGMSVEHATYCQYCVNERGELQSFDERFEKMVQWTLKENKDMTREEAEQKAKVYMKTMPAWKNHPNLSNN